MISRREARRRIAAKGYAKRRLDPVQREIHAANTRRSRARRTAAEMERDRLSNLRYRLLHAARLADRRREIQNDERRARNSERQKARDHRAALATVAWASDSVVRSIYHMARIMTKLTGEQHQVDHIIPLAGELVSGLHVESNLQVLTKAENSAKGNRYEIG